MVDLTEATAAQEAVVSDAEDNLKETLNVIKSPAETIMLTANAGVF